MHAGSPDLWVRVMRNVGGCDNLRLLFTIGASVIVVHIAVPEPTANRLWADVLLCPRQRVWRLEAFHSAEAISTARQRHERMVARCPPRQNHASLARSCGDAR
jgi:hypothetical protein